MTLEILLLILLIAQGVIGGIDTLVNHELIERLPYRIEARTEVGIHVLREAVYGFLFGALAWFVPYGAWAVMIGALLIAEIIIDACDEYVENRTRVLPQNERVLHFFLILNLGAITAVLTASMLKWAPRPTELVPIHYGIISWMLSSLALAAIGWSIRDFFAWRRLSHART
jgi:hypothetical protein